MPDNWKGGFRYSSQMGEECEVTDAKQNLKGSMSTRSTLIFKAKVPNGAKHLSLLQDKYGIVSADMAPNNIVFVCKSRYVDCL